MLGALECPETELGCNIHLVRHHAMPKMCECHAGRTMHVTMLTGQKQ